MRGTRCPKCQSRMVDGFLLDRAKNGAGVPHWVEGQPEYWFLRLLKLKGRRRLPVTTWRCGACGYLESYANEPATS